MRRRILLTVTATSVLILLAFLVPLAILVQSVAETRATSTAVLRVQSLVPIVGEATPRDLELSVDLINADAGPPVTVFLPGAGQVGAPAPNSEAVKLARTGRTVVVDTEVGREVAVPILGLEKGTAVVRVLVGQDELHRGRVPSPPRTPGTGFRAAPARDCRWRHLGSLIRPPDRSGR